MIVVHSSNKKDPFTIKRLEEKSKQTKKKSKAKQNFKKLDLISGKKLNRINKHIRNGTSNIRKAHKKSIELYEILKNISHASIEKDEEVNEIYEIIQSVYTKLEGLKGKHRKNHIEKTKVIEETIEDLRKVVRLVDELTQKEEKYKLKNVQKKLEETREEIEKTLINFLYIQSNDSSDKTAIQKVMDIKEARLQAQREKNVSKKRRKKYMDKFNDIFYARNFAIETIKKLMPLCEKLEISLPETLTKTSEVDEKPSIKNVKPVLELLLENIENIIKEMKNKNLNERELEEKKREMEILKERLKKHCFRVNKRELEESIGSGEKGRDQLKELEDLQEDHEDLSLKSQVSDDCIDESLNYNPIKLLKTHIDHDPMEQEEQSPIKIKTTGNLEISKKHKIGLEIDFSEASKSSDENSDEDLYDRGPYKKTKKKNYVESKYIEEDEL
jgi:hypothetical protein